MGNWGSERWSHLPESTQLVRAELGLKLKVVWLFLLYWFSRWSNQLSSLYKRGQRGTVVLKWEKMRNSYQDLYTRACACVCSVTSVVSDSATPWTVAHQAPLSMGFSRQEHWTGLPWPPPENLPDPGIEPKSPASPALQVDSLPTEPPGKPGT